MPLPRICVLALLLLGACAAPPESRSGRPLNVVFILSDNQGAWTLGCYGNKDIRSPNIDRLASEGMRFTRCFSSNAVCSPTRATFLTGLLPSQHGIHCYLNADEFQVGPDARCLIREFRSLPKILAENGYACGLSGKWHLGGNLTPQEGFTSWITMPHGHTTTFHGAEIVEDGKIRKEPGYLTEVWTDRAVRFIEENRSRPFFLFLAYNGPYGLGGSLLGGGRNRHSDYYADKEIPSFPREPMHPWLRDNKNYLNNVQAIRSYAAEVSAVDDGVGRVLEALRARGLERDTLVVFSADQGWAGGQHGIWGMGDHTRPLTAFDDQIHIPMIWRHAGRIPAGATSDLLMSNYDFLPTLLGYLGMKEAKPAGLPGRDFSTALRGESGQTSDAVFYEFENTRAIRTGEWKLIRRFPNGPDELYDLKADPGERRNLIGSGQADDLRRRLSEFFDRIADPKYNLWRGGVSKVRRVTKP